MTRSHITALLAGLIFGLGLLLSGMANPAKVLGFLDLAGNWDPSLLLVMGGAIAIGSVAFAVAKHKTHAWFGDPMRLPNKLTLDKRLILGSLGFGIGWGIAGFCPGPALVALGAGAPKALVFVIAMVAGMALFEWIEGRQVS